MKILSVTSALGLVATAGALLSFDAQASAPNAAITLKDAEHPVGCQAFGLHTTDRIHTVSTAGGNTKLICHFTVPEAQRPKKAERTEGFACGVFLPTGNKVTTDTSFQKTPGGEAKLECTVKL